MTAPLLKLENVSVTFGALRAVDGVSLSVKAGERRAIIGPNGAGKTTLFNAIAGDIRPSGGRVDFGGRNVTRLKPHAKAHLGIGRTYQITNLFAALSVEDNLRLAVRGLSPRKFSLFGSGQLNQVEHAAVEEALAESGMSARRGVPIRDLSYGEQRQLELALALAGKPTLLLLDEPAAGLSAAERVRMAEIKPGGLKNLFHTEEAVHGVMVAAQRLGAAVPDDAAGF